MAQHKSFNNEKNKLREIWENTQRNKNDLKDIERVQVIEHPVTGFKKREEIVITTEPDFYDLYDFQGITFQSGGFSPTPEDCYEETEAGGEWYFKFPVFDFRVPVGEDPAVLTGCPDWEYASTIANVRQSIRFNTLSEWAVNHSHLESFLFTEDDTAISIPDFTQFYRWIKNNQGYTFEYYAFYTLPEDTQVFLKASIILLNKRNYNGIQHRKIKDL